MYLEFLKKYKLYVAIILAVFAGFLLCFGFFFLFKKDETIIPVNKTSTDENLVYFDVKSKDSASVENPPENIDESDLNTEEYNNQITEILVPKPEVRIPVEKTQKLYPSPKKSTLRIKKPCKIKQYKLQARPAKSAKLKKIISKKTKPYFISSSFLKIPLPFMSEKEIKTLKLEYANAFDLADFINKNIISEKPVATAKGNSEILLVGSPTAVLNAEKVVALLDIRPKVAVFKLNYIKPCKMSNMIANSIFNGNCIVCQDGDEIPQKTSPYAIYYNNNQNSITIVGASKKQMDLVQDFIQFTDIKSPQAFLDILVVEFNDVGSRQFQKFSQFNINPDCSDYGVSSQNLYNYIFNIINSGGGKILAKPHLTIANDSCYNINVTSDYIKNKQNKDVYNIEQDCGTKLKIYSCINPKGEVFLTLEPQYVTVKKSIPNERNTKATLFNRKSFKFENIKLKDRQTMFFGGVNSQQEYKKMGRLKIVNTELVMFVNVRLLD